MQSFSSLGIYMSRHLTDNGSDDDGDGIEESQLGLQLDGAFIGIDVDVGVIVVVVDRVLRPHPQF